MAAAAEARPVYLDYNATTPIDPEVAQAMLPFLHGAFGNPSSGHTYGREARAAVSQAGASVAALVGCDPDEVFFTSGGTESNNWALAGAAQAHRGPRAHLVVSAVEHPAVAEVAAHLVRHEGCAVSVVPVDRQGLVDAGAVLSAVSEETVLVSIIHANNEVGSVQPIRAIAEAVRPRGVLVHTEASQSLGKVPIDWAELGVDLLTIAGHKPDMQGDEVPSQIYAPKGVGALIIRKGVKIHNLLHGAGLECGMRAGTESVLLIVGLGKACELAMKYMERDLAHMQNMKERLLKGLLHELVPKQIALCINSPQAPSLCLPNTLSISLANRDQGKLLDQVLPEVACSAGSACHSGHYSISPVLVAMNVPQHLAQCTLRLSTGRYTAEDEVDQAITTIARAVLSL
eukprot:SM000251S08811  [mRNA]  locus=s251:57895:60343:+ [translate_table: standard]